MAYTLTYELINNNTSYEVTGYTGEPVNVVIPKEYNALPVTSIGGDAFSWCDSLTSVVIPDSITTIGGGAFSYCESLTSIEIPNSITTIGDSAFYGCSSLTKVTLLAKTPATLAGSVFTNISTEAKFYCLSSVIEVYKTATNWNTYANQFVADDMRIYFTMNSRAQKEYFASKEWAINKFANQMPWSQELIDSCVDLGGWTVKFNTGTKYVENSTMWPVTTWLVSSGGYALGVGGPPVVQLKGIDGKLVDTITIADFDSASRTHWLLDQLTLPEDFGYILKIVGTSGEPSSALDALPSVNWSNWDHIMPGGFIRTSQGGGYNILDLFQEEDTELIFDGGSSDTTLAVLNRTILK